MMSQTQHHVLPLPLELREHIYDYLLAADRVQATASYYTRDPGDWSVSRRVSGAHTYDIDTTILRLNHSTRDEALARLHKSNTFVKIGCRCPGLVYMLHLMSVPMVCADSTKSNLLRQFSMEVEIESDITWDPTYVMTEKEWGDTRFIMVARDLPILCQSLRTLFFARNININSYLFQTDGTVRYTSPRGHLEHQISTRLIFRLYSTRFKKMTSRLEESLLQPFSTTGFVASSSVIDGSVRDLQETHRMEGHVAPKIVWLNAFLWRYLETAQNAFARALSLLHAGTPKAAAALAEIALYNTECPYFSLLADNAGDLTQEIKQCLLRLHISSLDVFALIFIAFLRDRDYKTADWFYKGLHEMMKTYYRMAMTILGDEEFILLKTPEHQDRPIVGESLHPDWLWTCAVTDLVYANDIPDDHMENMVNGLKVAAKLYPEKDYIQHDADVIKLICFDGEVYHASAWLELTREEKYEKLSFACFENLELGTPQLWDYSVPEGISGFTDVTKSKALQEGRLRLIEDDI